MQERSLELALKLQKKVTDHHTKQKGKSYFVMANKTLVKEQPEGLMTFYTFMKSNFGVFRKHILAFLFETLPQTSEFVGE